MKFKLNNGTRDFNTEKEISNSRLDINIYKDATKHMSGEMTPLEALESYFGSLTAYERKEIMQYEKIYFLGRSSRKHLAGNPDLESLQKSSAVHQAELERKHSTAQECSPTFDDEESFYRVIKHDHIAYRFEVLSLLGKGSFGQVVRAIDHMKGTQVALKIIRTESRFTRQAKEEIRILETLRQMRGDSPTDVDGREFPIVQMFEHFTFRKHICMTFELLSINLYDLLKLNKFIGLSRDRVRRISFQVLKALYYVEKAGIIHCDLKPENILLIWHPDHFINQPNEQSELGDTENHILDSKPNHLHAEERDYVKLIDFGSSCYKRGPTYPYIQSRFYRAPEVILRTGYGQPIDMWSFGCLVAELINGLPLFPGEDEGDQLACIMEVLGVPPAEMLQNSPQVGRYFVEHRASKSANSDVQNFVERITMSPHRDVVYLPRYCSIRYPDDGGPPELGPGVAKRSGHKRGVPASKPLLSAILQPRHGRFRHKDSQSMANLSTDLGAFRTTEEKVVSKDNELLLSLMLACLTWLPNERIKPYKAIQHGWLQNFSKRSAGSSQPRQRIRSMEVSQMLTYRASGPIRLEKDYADQSNSSTHEPVTAIPRRRKAAGRSRTECISSRPITICDANTGTWFKEEPITQSTDSSKYPNDQVTRTNIQMQPSSYQLSWIPTTKTKTVSPVTSLGSIVDISASAVSSKGSDQTTRRVTLIYANAKNAGAPEDSETDVVNATSEGEATRVRVGHLGVPYETNTRRESARNVQTAHLNTSRRPYSEFYSVTEMQQCNTNAERSGTSELTTGPITSSVDSNGKFVHTRRTCRQIPSSNESGDQQYSNLAHTFQLAYTGGLALRNTNSGNNGQVIITKVLEPVNAKGQPRMAQAIRRNSELMTSSILNVNEPRLIGVGNRRHGLPNHVSDENARYDQQHTHHQACRGDQSKQGTLPWNPLTSPTILKTKQNASDAGLPDVTSKYGRDALSYSLNRVIHTSDGPPGEDNGWAKHTHYQQLSAAQNNIILRRIAVPPQYRGTVVELRSHAHNMKR